MRYHRKGDLVEAMICTARRIAAAEKRQRLDEEAALLRGSTGSHVRRRLTAAAGLVDSPYPDSRSSSSEGARLCRGHGKGKGDSPALDELGVASKGSDAGVTVSEPPSVSPNDSASNYGFVGRLRASVSPSVLVTPSADHPLPPLGSRHCPASSDGVARPPPVALCSCAFHSVGASRPSPSWSGDSYVDDERRTTRAAAKKGGSGAPPPPAASVPPPPSVKRIPHKLLTEAFYGNHLSAVMAKDAYLHYLAEAQGGSVGRKKRRE